MGFLVDSFLQHPLTSYALIITFSAIILLAATLATLAYRNGREINILGIEIRKSRQEDGSGPIVKRDSFTVCDIMDAHDLWNNFQGTFYAWNPSWQTELVTSPSEWSDVHLRRYTDKAIERVVYAVSRTPLTNDEHSRFYYLEGTQRFFQKFAREHPEIIPRLEEKLEVYVVDKLPSNLSFFLGRGKTHKMMVALLLVNEEPFSRNGTPTLAFRTENEEVQKQMRCMFDGIMNKVDPTPVADLIDGKA